MLWAKAKAMVELSDMDICQAVYHLSDIHFSTTIFCLSFRRHFSTQHPLYDVMKFHCEGTTPHISLSYQALSEPESAGHLLFTMGHDGFLKLAQQAYDKHFYGKLDYHELLEVEIRNVIFIRTILILYNKSKFSSFNKQRSYSNFLYTLFLSSSS